MTVTGLALAVLIGGVMGLLGAGGSILAVPAFTFILGLPAKEAVVTSLVVVGFAAGVGAVRGFARGIVPPALAFIVGASAMIGSAGGSFVGTRISDERQLQILAVVMLAAAIMILRQPGRATVAAGHASPLVLAAIGFSTGMLTGIVGVGGGFLITPLLIFYNIPPVVAVATGANQVVASSSHRQATPPKKPEMPTGLSEAT